MKAIFIRLLFLVSVVLTMISCSSNSSEDTTGQNSTNKVIVNFSYNADELEAISLINAYRKSIGLNELKQIEHISYKSEEHCRYMISKNGISHDNFASRSENIIKVLGAKTVAENIAYNYNTPKAVLDDWLLSPVHKVNLDGDYTNFGIAIRTDAEGRKYYNLIFAKI
jgi:uncharacterized protein YkwD